MQGSAIQYGGLVRGVYRVGPTLALRAALGYRQTFYGPTYLVLAGLDWKVSDRVRVFGELPASLTASYAVAPKLNAGLDVLANAATYRFGPRDQYVRYRTLVTGLFAEYYVQPQLALRLTAGYSVLRNVEVYNKGDQVTGVVDLVTFGTAPVPLNPTVGNGAVVRLALSYRLVPRQTAP